MIREARRRAGLTQAELAERINTAQPNVARWESADMSPTVDVLSRIVQACGLELIVRLIPREANDWTVVEDSQANKSMDERLEKLIGFVDVIEDGAETKASRSEAKTRTNKRS